MQPSDIVSAGIPPRVELEEMLACPSSTDVPRNWLDSEGKKLTQCRGHPGHFFGSSSTRQRDRRGSDPGYVRGGGVIGEWLGLSKLLPGAASAAKAVFRVATHQVDGADEDRPVAVVSPGGKAEIRILRTTSQDSRADQLIRVTARWRTARGRPFSRSAVSVSISVQDIRDLLVEVESKQPVIVLV